MVRREKETVNSSNCGTARGYRRHMYVDEEVCDGCRTAYNSYGRDMYRAKYGHRESSGVKIADYVETFAPLDVPELVMLIQLRHDIPTGTIRQQTYRMLRDGRLSRDDVVSVRLDAFGNVRQDAP